jgi:hypothetical protein
MQFELQTIDIYAAATICLWSTSTVAMQLMDDIDNCVVHTWTRGDHPTRFISHFCINIDFIDQAINIEICSVASCVIRGVYTADVVLCTRIYSVNRFLKRWTEWDILNEAFRAASLVPLQCDVWAQYYLFHHTRCWDICTCKLSKIVAVWRSKNLRNDAVIKRGESNL